MRTFDGVMDGLWKPQLKVDLRCTDYPNGKSSRGHHVTTSAEYKFVNLSDVRPYQLQHQDTKITCSVQSKYDYAKEIMKPFYGRDIGEPVVKICKRILEKPRRFHALKWGNYSIKSNEGVFGWTSSPITKVLQDKDTQVKFVLGEYNKISHPTYLTDDEQKLLYTVISEWSKSEHKRITEKEKIRDQKRKDKFRQEMVDIYKDY